MQVEENLFSFLFGLLTGQHCFFKASLGTQHQGQIEPGFAEQFGVFQADGLVVQPLCQLQITGPSGRRAGQDPGRGARTCLQGDPASTG